MTNENQPATKGVDLTFLFILFLSFAIVAFLFWWIYWKPVAAGHPDWLDALPVFNATMNGLCSICLISGYAMIRNGRKREHVICMMTGTVFSALFLGGYLLYHAYHGESKFQGTGTVRPVYFFILISHIVLSVFALPMILTTLYKAFSGNFTAHRAWARWTLPVWLYVSVTGVLIFVILRAYSA